MKRVDFFLRLNGMYPKVPDDEALKIYERAIQKWGLSGNDLQKLFEAIVDNCRYYPTVAEIKELGQEAGLFEPKSTKPTIHWQLFTLDGVRYSRKISDPSDPPALPAGACDVTIAIGNPDTRREDLPTDEEKRECFRQGWALSGADPAKCDAIFNAATAALTTAIESRDSTALVNALTVADYDDSPQNDRTLNTKRDVDLALLEVELMREAGLDDFEAAINGGL